MVEAQIDREKAAEQGDEDENAGAQERRLVDRRRDLDAARCPDAAALANAAYDQPAVDVANAADAALGGGVGHFREHRQRFPQRLSIASSATLYKAEMIGAEHVDQAPGDSAAMGHFAATAQLRHDRLAGRRRTGNAHQVQGNVVDQPKIGPAYSDRKMLGQKPVRPHPPPAQLPDSPTTSPAPPPP